MEENNVDLISQLNYLAQTKQQIKSAIIEKGQEVSDLDTFRSYASKIENINTLNPQVINVTPQIYAQSILPDENHNAISEVIVEAVTSDIDPNIINGNIKNGVTILGVSGKSTVVDTEDSNATAEDIMDNSTAYVNGQKLTGTFNIKSEISAQNSLISNQENTINQLTNLISNIYASDVNVVTADANITNLDVMEGKIGYSNNGQKIVGTKRDTFNIPMYTSIKVDSIVAPNDKLVIDLPNWNVSNMTKMSDMFYSCNTFVYDIDLSNWNVSNVITMSNMFYNIRLGSDHVLNLTGWNTGKVTNMCGMFYNVHATVLGLSDFNVEKVVNMYGMFNNCDVVNSIDVSNWNVSNVNNMKSMFHNCNNLVSLNVANWNVSNVNNMQAMFYSCSNLVSLNVVDWDTTNATDIGGMFGSCSNLVDIDVSNWSLPNITNIHLIFSYCNNLSDESIDSIINMCLNININNIPASDRTLTMGWYGIFGWSNISNTRYQSRWSELTAAGWTY